MLFYGGPDQIIPLASALSTIGGLALIFWGRLIQASRKIFSVFSKNTHHAASDDNKES